MSFGVPPELVADLRIARPDEIVWMGRIPARIDFLQTVPGLEFEASWAHRVTSPLGGVPVQFISRDDLLINKRAVGRPQDIRDVRALERAAEAERRKRSVATHAGDKKPARRKR